MHSSSFENRGRIVPGRPPPWPSWKVFVLARRSRCVLFTLTSTKNVAISCIIIAFLLFPLSIVFYFMRALPHLQNLLIFSASPTFV